MKLLVQNKKMKVSSDNGVKVYNFGIPAFRSDTGLMTCPQAGVCAAGCYAKSGAYLFSNVKSAYEARLQATLKPDFIDAVSLELDRILKNKSTKQVYVRIHDSGDYYNLEYFQTWLKIAMKYPNVIFYSYTKMVKMLKGHFMPSNFKLIFSLGGKQDNLIDQSNDRHSRVFESMTDLVNAGYVNASEHDLIALGENKRIGLLFHHAKSFKNTLWDKVKVTLDNNKKVA